MTGWTGVDLDGTLATYDRWRGPDHIGEPIGPMVERVRRWLDEGVDVRIFTARVGPQADPRCADLARRQIEVWCRVHLGEVLPITNEKDYGMVALYDDRCVRVETNTGRVLSEEDGKGLTP